MHSFGFSIPRCRKMYLNVEKICFQKVFLAIFDISLTSVFIWQGKNMSLQSEIYFTKVNCTE